MNSAVIVSGGQQWTQPHVFRVSILPPPQTPLPSRLPHNPEQSSLSSIAGPCSTSTFKSLTLEFQTLLWTWAARWSTPWANSPCDPVNSATGFYLPPITAVSVGWGCLCNRAV